MAEEKVLLPSEGILVANTRVVLGSATYPLANITSVSLEKIPRTLTTGIVILLVGALLVLCSFTGKEVQVWSLVVGGLVAVLGGFALYGAKDQYSVSISTAAGQQRALQSANEESIKKVVTAINEAIVSRG
jgi:hypothetical protein